MSDQEVMTALDGLERLLGAPSDTPLEPEAMARWNGEFNLALADAQRGPRWPEIKVRARELKARLDQRVAGLRGAQQGLKQELQMGALGSRALAGYRPRPR